MIKNRDSDYIKLDTFLKKIDLIKTKDYWTKTEIIKTFNDLLFEFNHKERQKNLDDKM